MTMIERQMLSDYLKEKNRSSSSRWREKMMFLETARDKSSGWSAVEPTTAEIWADDLDSGGGPASSSSSSPGT